MTSHFDDPLFNPDALELFLCGGGFDLDVPSLLAGIGAAATSPPTGGQGGGLSTLVAPQETAPPTLRCLDANHAPGCTQCTPPPDADEAARFEIVGDRGLRNGEKKLRSLLARTCEWGSCEARCAAAERLQESLPRLAAALRSRSSSALSKELMLALLKHWGYKSNLWVRRGNRLSRSAAPHAPCPATSATVAMSAAWPAKNELLQPLAKAAFDGIAGPLARAEAERCAESAGAYFRELPLLRSIVEHLRQKWMPATSNLLAWALAGSEAERCAACVAQVIEIAQRTYAGLEQRSRAQMADPTCGPAQRLWLQEMAEGQQAQQRIFEELTEFLGRHAASDIRAPATVAVVQFLTMHITSIVGGFDARIGWLNRLAENARVIGVGDDGRGAAALVDVALPLRTLPPTELTNRDAAL